jgi:hypothetical protein
MERIWNKGMAAVFLRDIIGRAINRETGGGGKEGNVLRGNIETNTDAKLKKDFKSSYKKANAGFIAWCVLAIIVVLCLVLWTLTGVPLFAVIGASSFLLA